MKPSILLYTDDPERGGVAQYNHALLLALAAAGYDVACVQSESRSPLIAAQRDAGVRHLWLPYDTGKEFGRTLTDETAPRAIFEAEQPALIIFSDCCPISNLAARNAAMSLGIPFLVVVGFVGAYLAKKFAHHLGAIGQHYAEAAEVVAVSEENLQMLRAEFGLAADRGTVIHYGRPAEFFRPVDPARRRRLRAELGLPADAVVGLTTARLTGVKGYLYQLAAIEWLLRERPQAPNYFVWMGEGDQRAMLEAEIQKKNLQDRVKLTGHRWNMSEWYDIADLYILPSEMEGMPLAIMEAMAKSLPVVASAVSGIPEELGPTGQLLPDPKQSCVETAIVLAQTIALWTDEPELRRRLGAACRARAEQFFHEERMIARTLALVARGLERAPSALAEAAARR